MRTVGVLLAALVLASLASAAPTAQVAITDAAVTPPLVAVDERGSVTWRNTGSRSHRLVSGDRAFAPFTLAPGAERTVAFTGNGRHPYTVDGVRCGVVFVGVPLGAGCSAGRGRTSGSRAAAPRVGTKTYAYDVDLVYSVKNHGRAFYDGRREREWVRTFNWRANFRNLRFRVVTAGRLSIGLHVPAPRPAVAPTRMTETWDYFWHPHVRFPPNADCDGTITAPTRVALIAAVDTSGSRKFNIGVQLAEGWDKHVEIEADCNSWHPPTPTGTEFRLSDGTHVEGETILYGFEFERGTNARGAPVPQLVSGAGFTIDTGLRTTERNLCEGGGLCAGSTLTIEERYVAVFKPRRR